MNGPDNLDRAQWARLALVTFAEATRQDGDEHEEVVSDLLCDLRHFCDLAELDWTDLLRRAEMHYEAEVEEEEVVGPHSRFAEYFPAPRRRPVLRRLLGRSS